MTRDWIGSLVLNFVSEAKVPEQDLKPLGRVEARAMCT